MQEDSVDDVSAAARIPHTPKGDTARFGRQVIDASDMSEQQRAEFTEGVQLALQALEDENIHPASGSAELRHRLGLVRSRMEEAEGTRSDPVPQSVMDPINDFLL